MVIKKLLIEFIGTFFLATTFVLTNGSFLAPLAVGAVFAALVYMGYAISGAHYNPATTLAMLILKKISVKDFSFYILIQLLASFSGAFCYFLIWGRNMGIPRPSMEINILKSLFIETIFTFILVLMYLFVTDKKSAGNNFYGLAIGLTLIGIGIASANTSGGAFNPAIGLGPMLVDKLFGTCSCNPFEYGWIYLAGPLIGGIVAAVAFRIINPNAGTS
ncbi:MAG: aquaporin family protein [Bacteroidetes bacterium]|nr:aquaporin family protein [Bacteroidota bacterium]